MYLYTVHTYMLFKHVCVMHIPLCGGTACTIPKSRVYYRKPSCLHALSMHLSQMTRFPIKNDYNFGGFGGSSFRNSQISLCSE